MVFVLLVEQCCSKRRSWLWKPPTLTFGLLALQCHQLGSRDCSFAFILFFLLLFLYQLVCLFVNVEYRFFNVL